MVLSPPGFWCVDGHHHVDFNDIGNYVMEISSEIKKKKDEMFCYFKKFKKLDSIRNTRTQEVFHHQTLQ